MSWFPLGEDLLYQNERWKSLTTVARVMALCCISEANLRQGAFYRSHFNWAARLHTSFDTARRAAKKLQDLQWVHVKPGQRNDSGFRVASEYEVLLPFQPDRIQGHWSQMPRFLFAEILERLGTARALAFVYVAAEYHRNRARYAARKNFHISLGEMKRESGLRDFYGMVKSLHDDWKYANEKRLFEFTGYNKLIFTEWNSPLGLEEVNADRVVALEQAIEARARKLMALRNADEEELQRIEAGEREAKIRRQRKEAEIQRQKRAEQRAERAKRRAEHLRATIEGYYPPPEEETCETPS